MPQPQIAWFRRDLRLTDQAAVRAAAAAGPVIAVFVLDDDTPKHRRMGGASRWWLHHSLSSLDADLRARGSRLILRRGPAHTVLAQLADEVGASAIHALRHYEPWWRNAENALAKALPSNVEFLLHDGNFLLPPGSATTGAGTIFKIYTPFWRALRERMPPPMAQPAHFALDAAATWPASDSIADWDLLPIRPNWASGFTHWTPGESGAAARLDDFVGRASRYDGQRNLPSVDGCSSLSPHLHFGEISPAAVWNRLVEAGGSVETFLKELVWRDYAQNQILAAPEYGRVNGKPAFDSFPWRDPDHDDDAARGLAAWQQGQTGYPIIDAGMRQLWATGWMHNRVRMLAASFLVKHLLIDWRVGERWFWDTLVDADYASNATNWQWTAGSGVDANMFVRIMAPLSQSEKFDAGDYIRRWVPELSEVDDPYVHDPAGFGVAAPRYPVPIVGHKAARERALSAYAVFGQKT